jgi:hypothetical protein
MFAAELLPKRIEYGPAIFSTSWLTRFDVIMLLIFFVGEAQFLHIPHQSLITVFSGFSLFSTRLAREISYLYALCFLCSAASSMATFVAILYLSCGNLICVGCCRRVIFAPRTLTSLCRIYEIFFHRPCPYLSCVESRPRLWTIYFICNLARGHFHDGTSSCVCQWE